MNTERSELEELLRLHLDPRVLAAEAFPEAVLMGGPLDGSVECLFAPVRERLLRSPMRGILALCDPDSPVPPTWVYDLARVDGEPSRDDRGSYVYRYVGEQL